MNEEKDAFDYMVEVDNLNEEIEILESTVSDLKGEVENLNERIVELEKELDELTVDCDAYIEERDNYQYDYDSLVEYYTDLCCWVIIISIGNSKECMVFEEEPDEDDIKDRICIENFDPDKDEWEYEKIEVPLINNGGRF